MGKKKPTSTGTYSNCYLIGKQPFIVLTAKDEQLIAAEEDELEAIAATGDGLGCSLVALSGVHITNEEDMVLQFGDTVTECKRGGSARRDIMGERRRLMSRLEAHEDRGY